ncbi:MAG: alkaline phosphatase D family protein [Verrucomicrobiales bacterium]
MRNNSFLAASCLVVSLVPSLGFCRSPEEAGSVPVSRILFGSCIKQDQPIPILDTVVGRDPDLFLFIGDNIYADTADMAVMRAKYETLGADVGFVELREACPVLATWDDHDYGLNDAGADYPMRDEAQEVFVDFWKDPADSPRRRRPGVYDSRLYGPEGKRLQVILLDTRYFRGPLKKGERRTGGPYYPDEDPSIPMLGEVQWEWLRDELREPAEVRLVVSGIQLVAEAAGQETWSNLPAERKRFFELVAETEANGVVVLSGDRHWSEISCETDAAPYPIYDLTSSSLNQVHPRGTPTENRFRVSETTYHVENFGEVSIDWEDPDPELRLRVLDIEGNERLGKTLRLSELRSR